MRAACSARQSATLSGPAGLRERKRCPGACGCSLGVKACSADEVPCEGVSVLLAASSPGEYSVAVPHLALRGSPICRCTHSRTFGPENRAKHFACAPARHLSIARRHPADHFSRFLRMQACRARGSEITLPHNLLASETQARRTSGGGAATARVGRTTRRESKITRARLDVGASTGCYDAFLVPGRLSYAAPEERRERLA
jgi:hypothetical protein